MLHRPMYTRQTPSVLQNTICWQFITINLPLTITAICLQYIEEIEREKDESTSSIVVQTENKK